MFPIPLAKTVPFVLGVVILSGKLGEGKHFNPASNKHMRANVSNVPAHNLIRQAEHQSILLSAAGSIHSSPRYILGR